MSDYRCLRGDTPHEYELTDVETDDGPKPLLSRCRWCHRTKRQIEQQLRAQAMRTKHCDADCKLNRDPPEHSYGCQHYTKLEGFVYPPFTRLRQYPHCDELILHAPGECEYCDRNPEAQKERTRLGYNFSGKDDLNLKQCPAEERRSLLAGQGRGREVMNRWPGNRPQRLGTE